MCRVMKVLLGDAVWALHFILVAFGHLLFFPKKGHTFIVSRFLPNKLLSSVYAGVVLRLWIETHSCCFSDFSLK